MKSLKIITGIAITAVGITTAVAAGVTLSKQTVKEANAETFVADFSGSMTRRIYFVNGGDNGTWYGGNQLYVYAWSGENNSGLVKSTTIYGDYYAGLCFADVTFVGAGGSISVKFSSNGSWGAETEACVLPALSSKSEDSIFVDNAYKGSGRQPAVAAIGTSIAQLKCTLDHIQTCEESYHDGYYAYPQLKADFFDACNEMGSAATTPIGDKDKEEHTGYTVQNKIDKLEALYTASGWTVA